MDNSKLLRINSRYRSAGSTNSFTVCFTDSDVFNATAFELVSFTMVRQYTNVHSANNEIRTSNGLFYIPVGQYDFEQLVNAMNQVAVGITFVIAGNHISMYTTAQNFTFFGSRSTIGPYIGQTADVTWVKYRLCDHPVNLSGPELFLQFPAMTALCSEPSGNSNTAFIPLVAAIPTHNIEYRAVINYEPKQKVAFQFGQGVTAQHSLNCIEVQLVDQFGNFLNIPANCFCNIILKYYF